MMICKIKNFLYKACNDRKLVLTITFLFIVAATVYHYSLRLGFIPNGEDMNYPCSVYRSLKYTGEYHVSNLYSIIALFTVKAYGATYTSMRVIFTICYLILLLFMIPLVFKKDDTERNYLFILPLFALFMVFLRPVGGFDSWGQLGGDDLIIQWGYDYHYEPRIIAMLSLILLQSTIKNQKSTWLKFVFAGSILYGLHLKDLTYLVMFVAPLIIVYLLKWMKNEKNSNALVWLVVVGAGGILLSRILPGDILTKLWSKNPTGQYGYIYGGTNWSDITGFPTRFFQYIRLILQFFNVRLGKIPLISAYTVVYMVKVGLIVLGYVHIFRIAGTTIIGNREKYGYDEIDGILAWSFILLTIVYLFTDLGGATYSIRYMSGLVSSMTLVLCRNIRNLTGIINCDRIRKIKNKKVAFAIFISIICICYAEKTWTYTATDSYVQDFEGAIGYIKSNGGGYGIGRLWVGGRIMAMTGGEIEFYRSPGDVKAWHGTDAKATYMITDFVGETSREDWLVFDNCRDYEKLCEKYTKPSSVIEYEHFSLLVWDDGISTVQTGQ